MGWRGGADWGCGVMTGGEGVHVEQGLSCTRGRDAVCVKAKGAAWGEVIP